MSVIQYRGWVLHTDPKTHLWVAIKGTQRLHHATTRDLRVVIDAMEGPEIRDCCTGDTRC
jgi:hypothetical protein